MDKQFKEVLKIKLFEEKDLKIKQKIADSLIPVFLNSYFITEDHTKYNFDFLVINNQNELLLSYGHLYLMIWEDDFEYKIHCTLTLEKLNFPNNEKLEDRLIKWIYSLV